MPVAIRVAPSGMVALRLRFVEKALSHMVQPAVQLCNLPTPRGGVQLPGGVWGGELRLR